MLGIAVVAAVLPCSCALLVQEQGAATSSSRFSQVLPLNRQTFDGNVLEGDRVDNWVVFFCVDWYQPCADMVFDYFLLAEVHSNTLNQNSLFRDVVRFATVDCTVDKVLCNKQDVEMYPTVVHYKGGKPVRSRSGSRGSLEKWLAKELPSGGEAGAAAEAPLLSEAERALALRCIAAFAALLALFVWSVGQGADLWLAYTMARSRQHPDQHLKRRSEAPRQPAPVAAAAAAAAGGGLARRLPQDWARERAGVVL